MSELLPCPFCGGEPDEYEGEYGNGIYCMECGVMVGEPIHLGFNIAERVSYEQAIAAWNTRYHSEFEKTVIKAWKKIKDYTERTCKKQPSLIDQTCIVRRNCQGVVFEMEFGYWRCSECQCENFDGARYCMGCGAKVVSE